MLLAVGFWRHAVDAKTPNGFQRYVNEHNKAVVFYGQTVDQDGKPLPGVDIKAVVRHWTMPVPFLAGTDDIPMGRVTGPDGHFELNGATGDCLYMETIHKDGYEREPGEHTFGSVGGSSGQPVVFKMWSTNVHEKLISGEKKFPIEPDGRPYMIDLAKGTIAESGAGDLKVWIKYTTNVVRGQIYDWSCAIDVISGGLLEEFNLNSAMYVAQQMDTRPVFISRNKLKVDKTGRLARDDFLFP